MKLFVSYAHEDMQRASGAVALLSAGGHTLWFDQELLPGQDWKKELQIAISRCDALICAVTATALASEWCQWEIATAIRQQKPVIPVLLEPGVSLPDSLKHLHYADFSGGATALALAKLMAAISSMQKVAPEHSPAIPSDPKGVPARAWRAAAHWTDAIVPEVYVPQDTEESLSAKFAANLVRGAEQVGGRILLTNQRLLFEAHRANDQTEPLEIALSAIDTVTPSMVNAVFPMGITVRCKSGEEHQFVVWGRKKVISQIQECLGNRRPMQE